MRCDRPAQAAVSASGNGDRGSRSTADGRRGGRGARLGGRRLHHDRPIPVGAGAFGVAVDPAAGTIYVAGGNH
jgi:hypothetical protein